MLVGPLAIQAAIERKVLGSGLDYTAKALENVLMSGIVLEERFPERFYDEIAKVGQQRDKLVEWVEKFKVECGQYEDAKPYIARCETIIQSVGQLLQSCVGKAIVQKAIGHRDRAMLEYGLDYHCKGLEIIVEDGLVLDERFPERYYEKLAKAQQQRDKLAEWFAHFTSSCGQFDEAKSHIVRCEAIFSGLDAILTESKGKATVQKAIDDRSGSLAYGLDYTCKRVESTIAKGLKLDSRFPDRVEKELAESIKERDQLAEWIESFRSECGRYAEAAPHVVRVEAAIRDINTVINEVEGQIIVQRAIDDRKGPLEYGLDYSCKQLENTIKSGIQIDVRFPERAVETVNKTIERRDKLTEWFESFQSRCGRFREAEVHMDRVYVVLKDVETLLNSIQSKTEMQKTVDRKGALESSLDVHSRELNDGSSNEFETDFSLGASTRTRMH